MTDEICIHFGPFIVSWGSQAKDVIDRLKALFAGYESTGTPDIALRIVVSRNLPHPLEVLQQQWNPFRVHGDSFEMGPRVLQGRFSRDNREITLTVHEDVFNPRFLRIVHEFLYRLYYTLCILHHIDSVLVHGCGVVHEGAGYLFIGPHQSGKTTIGWLSGAPVLHDDQIILTFDGNALTMDSPPLPARHNLRQRSAAPCAINRIFLAVKDEGFLVTRLAPERALACLYNDIVLPHTLLSSDAHAARTKKARLCVILQQNVPLFELHFDKAGRFWHELSTMQWD